MFYMHRESTLSTMVSNVYKFWREYFSITTFLENIKVSNYRAVGPLPGNLRDLFFFEVKGYVSFEGEIDGDIKWGYGG
mgnify:CR=1 FL=1